MDKPWFQNNGQKIQLAVAALGVALTGFNAWPAISNFQLLNIAAIIFYILVFIAAFGFVRLFSPAPQVMAKDSNESAKNTSNMRWRLLPEGAQHYDLEVCSLKVSLPKGHDWSSGGDILRKLRIIYHDLVKEGEEYRADIELVSMTDFVGGSFTKALREKGRNRFLVPVARNEHSSAPRSVYSLLFSDDMIRFEFICLSHLNAHTGDIQLFICRGQGSQQALPEANPG